MTRIEKAIDLFNKGFQTKADQKRCLELVSRSYEEVRTKITDGFLNLRNEGKMSDEDMQPLYYGVPFELHQFRLKHTNMFLGFFPDEVIEIAYLIELRNQIKEQPIVKVVSKSKLMEEKVERVEKSLHEIFAKQMESYERGLEIAKIFGSLPVSVTPHWVFRDGGQFIRYFYFLAGKLTALNTIMAVAQTLEDEKEENK